MNLEQRLVKIRGLLNVIQKNKSGYGYRYTSDDEILPIWQGGADKYGVILVPAIAADSVTTMPYTYTKLNKKTKEEEAVNSYLVYGPMSYTFKCIDNPEDSLTVPWYFCGEQSDPSQAFGGGLTYSQRYFILKFFQIATPEDDPDHYTTKRKNAMEKEDQELARSIAEEISETIQTALNQTKDEKKQNALREALIGVVKVYEKSGNPMKLRDPDKAADALEAVTAYLNNLQKKGTKE